MAAKRSKPGSIADLTDDDNRRFQESTWKAERVGWLVMLVIVIAAVAGLFAGGPLSNVEETDPSGATFSYQRFNRHLASAQIRVSLPPSQGGQAAIKLSRALLQAFDIEHIHPMPARSVATSDSITLSFDVQALTKKPEISLSMKAMQIGLVNATIGLEGHAPVHLTQIVYP